MSHSGNWEVVTGLEVHVQLATESKIFSGTSTQTGDEPNRHASLIDLGMPGTLPVVNKEAIRNAIRFGLAVNADIARRSVFERKNYFYPDLPKGYQTTQLAEPIVGAGEVEVQLENGDKKVVRIHHAHLEEDAGVFARGLSWPDRHRPQPRRHAVDRNCFGAGYERRRGRGGVRAQAAFHRHLLGICDGDMSQGNMRFDVNISIRRPGDPLGTRTETKNLNSFRFMEKAIALEVARQIDVLEDGGEIVQETRLYNDIPTPPAPCSRKTPTITATSVPGPVAGDGQRRGNTNPCATSCRNCRTPARRATSSWYRLLGLRRRPCCPAPSPRRATRSRRRAWRRRRSWPPTG